MMDETIEVGAVDVDVVALGGRIYWLNRSIGRLQGHLAEAVDEFERLDVAAVEGNELAIKTIKLQETVVEGIRAKIQIFRLELASLPTLEVTSDTTKA
jgi:hypothetical protein